MHPAKDTHTTIGSPGTCKQGVGFEVSEMILSLMTITRAFGPYSTDMRECVTAIGVERPFL